MSCGADTDSIRPDVDAMLAWHLRMALSHRGEPDAREAMLIPHEAQLRAYVSVGALSEEEADDWRERFERAAEAVALPDREVASEQTRARARQLLEERFSALAPILEERQRKHERERPFRSALWDMSHVNCGAFSEKEADEVRERFVGEARAAGLSDREVASWLERARAGQLRGTPLQPLEPTSRAESSFSAALWTLWQVGLISDDERDRWKARVKPELASSPRPPPPEASFKADVLQRVVAGPSKRLSAIRVVCAELFDDCVTLRWHRLLSPEEASARAKINLFAGGPEGRAEVGRRWGAIFELRDDRGTRYERVAGDSGKTHRFSHRRNAAAVSGASTFIPPVPPAATRLEALNGSDRFSLVLADE